MAPKRPSSPWGTRLTRRSATRSRLPRQNPTSWSLLPVRKHFHFQEKGFNFSWHEFFNTFYQKFKLMLQKWLKLKKQNHWWVKINTKCKLPLRFCCWQLYYRFAFSDFESNYFSTRKFYFSFQINFQATSKRVRPRLSRSPSRAITCPPPATDSSSRPPRLLIVQF